MHIPDRHRDVIVAALNHMAEYAYSYCMMRDGHDPVLAEAQAKAAIHAILEQPVADAVPELLEACESAHSTLLLLLGAEFDQSDAVRKLRAAIRKAKGMGVQDG